MSYAEYTTASLEELFALGKNRGLYHARMVDMPEAGAVVRTDSDGVIEVTDTDSLSAAMVDMACDAESSNRDYSPFEFIANAINIRDDHQDAWMQYELGIVDGIRTNVAEQVALVAATWFETEGE
jgi:hypothetical protein